MKYYLKKFYNLIPGSKLSTSYNNSLEVGDIAKIAIDFQSLSSGEYELYPSRYV